MKKILFGTILLASVFISCSKDGDDDSSTPTESYQNLNSGSKWRYEEIDNTSSATSTYTIVSTNRDTTAEGRQFHIFTDSATAQSSYSARSGNDYLAYEPLPTDVGGANAVNIYLKPASGVNASWSQNYPIVIPGFPGTITVKVTNAITGKGINKTVNGSAYTNVIDVKTDISISGIPAGFASITTDIHSFYAPEVGLVERNARITTSLAGAPPEVSDETTRLKSAILL